MFWYRLCKIWVIFVGVNVRYGFGSALFLSMIRTAAGHLLGLCLKARAEIAGGVILIFILSFILLSNKAGEFPQTSYFRTIFLKFFLPLLTTIPSPES